MAQFRCPDCGCEAVTLVAHVRGGWSVRCRRAGHEVLPVPGIVLTTPEPEPRVETPT